MEDSNRREIPPRYYDAKEVMLECADTFSYLMENPDLCQSLKGQVGFSLPYLNTLREIEILAPRVQPVLILGERGTGKENLARTLHRLSKRPEDKFRAYLCGQHSDPARQRDELFGHWRTAFTGADRDQKGIFHAVDGGTLFLDEIGNLKPESQEMLNRATEGIDGQVEIERLGHADRKPESVRVRFVSAFNRPLRRSDFEEQRRREWQISQTETIDRLEDTLVFLRKPEIEEWSEEEIGDLQKHYMEGCDFLKRGEFPIPSEFHAGEGSPNAFNEDLADRLFKYTIRVLPLRQRPVDAIAITYFLSRTQDPPLDLDREEILTLAEHAAVANVRGIQAALFSYSVKEEKVKKQGYGDPLKEVGRCEIDGRYTSALMRFYPSIPVIQGWVDDLLEVWESPEGNAGKRKPGPEPAIPDGSPEAYEALDSSKTQVEAAEKLGVETHTLRNWIRREKESGKLKR